MPKDDSIKLQIHRPLAYRFVTRTIRILGTLMFRPIVIGKENIPETGPVLIAPVHRSNVDFAFSVFISRRKIFFIAKDSLFKIKPIGKFLLHLGAFPVNRESADRDSMIASELVLQNGQALILFPVRVLVDSAEIVSPLFKILFFICETVRLGLYPQSNADNPTT